MTESRQSRHGDINIERLIRWYGSEFAHRLVVVKMVGEPERDPLESAAERQQKLDRYLFNRRHYRKQAERIVAEDLQRIAHLAYPDRYAPPQEAR